MSAVLTMTAGPRPGAHYALVSDLETTIGRGAECNIIVVDTLCSRVHAVLYTRDGQWHVRDADSRNGTFVDGQPIGDVPLVSGQTIRVGSAEFAFQDTGSGSTGYGGGLGLTVVRDTPLEPVVETPPEPDAANPDIVRNLSALYQLAERLLTVGDVSSVLAAALERLRHQTAATTAGFLSLVDGRLQARQFDPIAPDDLQISPAVTQLVCVDQHAVWMADEQSNTAVAGGDALCVPTVADGRVLGALYLRLAQGRFRQSHFDLLIGAANLVAAALSRIQRRDSDQVSAQLDTLEVAAWERRLIVEALARTAGNIPEAARLLGLSRATLYRKVEDYGIERG